MPKRKLKTPAHQDFDKLLRSNIVPALALILGKVLMLDIQQTTPIPTTFPRTKEKRVDYAVKVRDTSGKEYIIHIEFQTKNDKRMHQRMLEYCETLYGHFGLDVIQFVLFIGSGKPSMITEISLTNLQYRYHIIDLKTIDYHIFLDSQKPEEIMLAILCQFTRKEAQDVITHIIERLFTAADVADLPKYFIQLEILSKLRNLQRQTSQTIEKMPIHYDLKTDIRYMQGVEAGEAAATVKFERTIKRAERKAEKQATLQIKEAERQIKEAEQQATKAAIVRLLKLHKLSIDEIAETLSVEATLVLSIQRSLEDGTGN